VRANAFSRDRRGRAEVGIGTMIVFIATVLIAAIAAAVLIDTSGKLQERATRAGQDTTTQVATFLSVDSIVGLRSSVSDEGLQTLEVYVSLAAGAAAMDLDPLRIQLGNGTMRLTLAYTSGAPGAGTYAAEAIRDPDGSFSAGNPAVTSGDVVRLTIELGAGANEMPLRPRDEVTMTFLPEGGAALNVGFSTPPSYGSSLIIPLK